MAGETNMHMTSRLLSDVTGRDKIMRTCQFTAGFLASLSNDGQKLRTIQGQISACRVVFRLFGDLPMWRRAKKANWGKTAIVPKDQARNPLMEKVSILNVAADLLYLPVEHIAWAAQNGLIPISAGRWWTGAITVWAVSLFLAISRSLSNIGALQRKMEEVKARNAENSREEYRRLRRQADNERLNVLRCSADFMCAINSLPKGFLWSGRLSPKVHCIFGIISSLTGLFQVKRDLYPPPEQC